LARRTQIHFSRSHGADEERIAHTFCGRERATGESSRSGEKYVKIKTRLRKQPTQALFRAEHQFAPGKINPIPAEPGCPRIKTHVNRRATLFRDGKAQPQL
jgi:hypothetical protein